MEKDLYVSESKIAGRGVFVGRSFKRGQVVSFLRGKVCKKHNENAKDAMSNSCWIGIGPGTWINPSYPYRYLNHSCNPSGSLRGKIAIVALRDLQDGEELTIDYSLVEADLRWHMPCRCKQPNCRKIIKAIEFLPPKTFKHYLPYIPNYFQKVYNEYHKPILKDG